MKLYIWIDPTGGVDYGGEVLYVVAENLREARREARNTVDRSYGMESAERKRIENLGKPTAVRNLPCSEYYMMRE